MIMSGIRRYDEEMKFLLANRAVVENLLPSTAITPDVGVINDKIAATKRRRRFISRTHLAKKEEIMLARVWNSFRR